LSVARLHDLRSYDSGTRHGSSHTVIATTQRDCGQRSRQDAGPSQLVFAGSFSDLILVGCVMFHDKSMWSVTVISTGCAGRSIRTMS
jgi:hypothetical protein